MDSRGWWLTALILVVAVLMRNSLLFLLGIFLALIGGAAYLWMRTCLTGVTYRRRLGATRLFHGETTDLYVQITNAKVLPLAWLRAEDEFPRALPITPARVAPCHLPNRQYLVNNLSLRWYERVTRHYRVQGLHRGAWTFGPVELASGDVFGFAVQRAPLDEKNELIVYPRLVSLAALGLPAERPFGDYRTRRLLSDDPLRISGARNYQPGDSPRQIHWRATARRGELQTKTFDAAASRPLAIFLNVNTFRYLWEGIDPECQEFCITVSAAIARWAWENDQPAGLYINAVAPPNAKPISIRPGTHPDQLLNILEALARVSNFGRWSIERTLLVEAQRLPGGSSVVLVTAQVSPELVQILADLRRRGFGVTLATAGAIDAKIPPEIRHYPLGGREAWRALDALALA
ncbi:MAG: DUF58 domain-containing protein [Anaerolineales bacterium]|nr:DUF58 domain-containing protein [Anaerolineales bacterium]